MLPRKYSNVFLLPCCRATKYFVLLSIISKYLVLHAKCPIFSSDFNQIWSFSSPVSNFTKIQTPTTCGRMDGRMVGRKVGRKVGQKDGRDEWRILIRRSSLAAGFKTPSIYPSASLDLRSVFPADEARLRTPDGNKKTDRRTALPEKLPPEHGAPLTRILLCAIPNPAYRETN